MSEWMIFAAIQVVGLVLVVVFIRMDYKAQHPPKPPICDSCINLAEKRNVEHQLVYRYKCDIRGAFDCSPEICRDYKPKEVDHE